MLIPGFLAGDASLGPMAAWLKRAGYRPARAGMRANVDCSGALVGKLEERLERVAREQSMRAVVIGQSRGGALAKVLAVRRPELVAGVVTLGSPQLAPLAVHPLVRVPLHAVGTLGSLGAPGLFRRSCLDGECCAEFWSDLAGPLPARVGLVAVYSRSDGIVDWRACLDPHADEQVEIAASHLGMAVSPAAWKAIASALERFGRAEERRRPGAARRRLRRAA
jgi:triacylglycerol lipase